MSGGIGDPWIEREDGTWRQIKGTPGAAYNLYTRGDVRVLPRVAAVPGDADGQTCFGGVDVLVGDVRVVVMTDGKTHVIGHGHHVVIESKDCSLDSPDHPGSTGTTTREPHPLQGVPHLNVTIPVHPEGVEGITGLVVAPDDADPESYQVVP